MPLRVEIGVKKKRLMSINLNQYRNWHYQVSNQVKTRYQKIVIAILKHEKVKPIDFPIEITLKLYKKNKRLTDKSNFLCIHEKFFCDALTKAGIIPDDNDNYIIQTTYLPTEIDKLNPRVDIEIKRAPSLEPDN